MNDSPYIQHHHDTLQNAGRILQSTCHGNAKNSGWWNDPQTGEPMLGQPWTKYLIGTKLALITSEVSEGLEGYRVDAMDNKLPHRSAIECELADTIIRAFDLAGALQLDVGAAIAEKLEYNAQRADHKTENRVKVGGKKF